MACASTKKVILSKGYTISFNITDDVNATTYPCTQINSGFLLAQYFNFQQNLICYMILILVVELYSLFNFHYVWSISYVPW